MEATENIARALEVELKALFDFMHLDPDAVTPKNLERNLDDIDEKNRRLLFRIANLMRE